MVFGQDNRLPAAQVARVDPEKFKHALAVARIINNSTGYSGTAFRIGPQNRMMTNAHVLSTGNPKDYRIEFTDAEGTITRVDGDRLLAFSARPEEKNLRPDVSVRQNLDFALFSIKPSQFDRIKPFGYLELNASGAKPGQEIYIPQHSYKDGGTPKTIAISDDIAGPQSAARINHVYREGEWSATDHRADVQYCADANLGASGSPVISADSHKVVALHNGTHLKHRFNVAANMSTIWQQIKGFFINESQGAQPDTVRHSASGPVRNRGHHVGDHRRHNGTLQELWSNPSGGERWVDVWQSKHYSRGDLVILEGNAYAYLGSVPTGTSPWVPAYDPKQTYRPGEQVYYYGQIVDANTGIRRRNRA